MSAPHGSIEDLRAQVALQREAIAQLEEERRRLEELLLDLPKLFATPDADVFVRSVAEAAASLTGAHFALFVSGDDDRTSTLVGVPESDFAELPSPGFAPLLGINADSGAARSIPDVARWASTEAAGQLYGTLADGRLVRSWMVAPVRGRDEELRGVLYLGHPRPHVFSAHHETQLTILASRLGLALDTAAMAAERDRVLAALESSLLPPLLPTIPAVDLAARYRAADDAALVGGDFYDVFRSGDRRWAVVLGDVCGSGPDAAAITGIARYTLRALAADFGAGASLERLNAALMARRRTGRFVTAIVAQVEAGDGELRIALANAGHPAPIVLRDDGTAEELDAPHGALLGVLPEISAPDVAVALAPGDALVLFTDGVFEARDRSGDLFGIERLLELVSTCAGRTAAGIARRIELGVMGHTARTSDDLAILVLRREPTAAA